MTNPAVMLTAFEKAANSRFNPKRDDYRHDPKLWAKERLGVHLWSKQVEILEALIHQPRVAVRSCHSSGKSFSSAVAVAWWLDTHPPKTARVVTTAPTHSQVKAILWNEINQLGGMVPVDQDPLPGRILQTEWYIDNYQAALGRKPNDYEPAAFQGLHALHLLVILDEADGMPAGMWNAVETLATNANARILGIGNPDDPQSPFRSNQSDQDMGDDNPGDYYTIRIAAADTPAFTGEKVPKIITDSLITKEWVAGRVKRWGEDNPLYVSKVLAEYAAESEFTVVRMGDLAACKRLDSLALPDGKMKEARGLRKLGVDFGASESGDPSQIRLRVGSIILGSWTLQSSDPKEQADWIEEVAKATQVTHVAFDNNGVGYGFDALLKARLPKVAVQPVNTAQAAPEPSRYVNLRAYLWWMMRLKLQNRELDLTYAEDPENDLQSQLLTPRWHMNKGKVQVEKKEEIRKRLGGKSTDEADALMLAVWDGAQAGTAVVHSPAQYQLPSGPRGRSSSALTLGRERGRW